MGYIKVNQDKVNQKIAQQLIDICPFNAFDYNDAYLSINAGCKVCKICVSKGPKGVCEYVEIQRPQIDKTAYKGIVVVVEQHENVAHEVSWELVGKAKELAAISHDEVGVIVIGSDTHKIVSEALSYGVDHIYLYEHKAFETFNIMTHTDIIAACHKTFQFNIILVGGTTLGRSLAPRVAARLKTGLTADCTKLEITSEGDLLQIRPAFGGNIMAKIVTPNHRPQLATIRYKMFDKPNLVKPHGKVMIQDPKPYINKKPIQTIETIKHPKVSDISEAEVIIAVGRAFKKQKDLELIEPLRKKLNAEVACTRPLIENGWFDPRKQIGLSGRTVKPKLIINLGISGAVQYIEGMKESELIITVNSDPNNRLFDISHYAIVGDIYQVLPELNSLIDQIMEVA
jgi:electron transfer flavoprotein alpha subunit